MKTTLFLITLFLSVGCGNQQKPQTLEEEGPKEQVTQQVIVEDTTVYDMPYSTAALENPKEYFRANNKFKDWDKANQQRVIVRAIIEKDSTASNIQVMKNDLEYPELKAEAIRLIEEAKILPALNENGEKVRSKWIIFVFCPPQ